MKTGKDGNNFCDFGCSALQNLASLLNPVQMISALTTYAIGMFAIGCYKGYQDAQEEIDRERIIKIRKKQGLRVA